MRKLLLFFITVFILVSCKSTYQSNRKGAGWFNVAVTDGIEVYTDTNSIKNEGAVAYAREKRVYTTPESRKQYVDEISREYVKMGKPNKADRWKDFSYCIYNSLYECTNKRFRVLSVEDYDSKGRLIAKTIPAKDKLKWLNVNVETVGDYTFFFVCDYKE